MRMPDGRIDNVGSRGGHLQRRKLAYASGADRRHGVSPVTVTDTARWTLQEQMAVRGLQSEEPSNLKCGHVARKPPPPQIRPQQRMHGQPSRSGSQAYGTGRQTQIASRCRRAAEKPLVLPQNVRDPLKLNHRSARAGDARISIISYRLGRR